MKRSTVAPHGIFSPSRARKLAIGLGITIAVLFLGHLAAARYLLQGPKLRELINTDPEHTEIRYDAATSVWPGRVTVRNLRIRGSDSNVQWAFHIDEARLTYSLLDLFDKRFHATRLRVRGLVFRLRQFPAGKTPMPRQKAAVIPEIPGFQNPPRPAAPPPRPPEPRSGTPSRAWAVQVEHLVADPAPEIWVESYRFQGRARVTGGFYLRPHERAEVGPAAVEFLEGTLDLGPSEPILRKVTGRADCRIEPFNQDRVTGDHVWPNISGAVHLEGAVERLVFLNYFLGPGAEPSLSRGRGRGSLAVQIERGIARGSVELDARDFAARYSDTTLAGNLTARINLARWELERDRLDISGSRVTLEDVSTSGARNDSRAWWGRFDLPVAEIRDGFTAHVRARCRDGRPLFTLFDLELPRWTQGLQNLEGLTAESDVRLGRKLLVINRLDAKGGSFHIEGRYRKKANDRDGAFLIDTGPVNVGVAIQGGRTSLKLIDARGWFRRETAETRSAQRSGSTTTAVP